MRIAALVFDTVGCEDDLATANISQSKLPIDVALTAVIDRFVTLFSVRFNSFLVVTGASTRGVAQ